MQREADGMKKIFCLALNALIISAVFFRCGFSGAITLHETPQIYVLSGENEFMLMPTVTLYENGNARLSQPVISSLGLFNMGHYEIDCSELTVSHGENASVTFRISDNGNRLTIISASLRYAKSGSVYQYLPNAGYKL